MPCPQGTRWKEHRTVCLPDFQGVGIGNAMSNFIASCFHGIKGRYYLSVTANPAISNEIPAITIIRIALPENNPLSAISIHFSLVSL